MAATGPANIAAFQRLRQHGPTLVSMLLLGALWLAQVTPYPNPANDAGRYLTLGTSLARSGELRLLNQPDRPLDTLYPPLFPAIIALCIRITGHPAGEVILLVKVLQLLFLLATLPLLALLLERSGLPRTLRTAALITAATAPAFASYANEVMSEAPFLFFCLAAITLVETDSHATAATEKGAVWRRILALLCATLAFFTRTAGLALLLALSITFWRRSGYRWGIIALTVALVVSAGWQWRNQHIIRHAPPGTQHATYLDQFTLRDPTRAGAGRIPLTPAGLLERVREGFPVYLGMIPRAVLHTMSRHAPLWNTLFWVLAVPMGLLILAGGVVAWQRGLTLAAGFAALFWVLTALWPWRDPRFLVPLLPCFLLFLFLGVESLAGRLPPHLPAGARNALAATSAALLLAYFGQVHLTIIQRERLPVLPGFPFGRTLAEAGFYAAATWLRAHTPPDSVIMGRPAYLLFLYSDRPSIQIEPHPRPAVQEQAARRRQVDYLLQDAWPWSRTRQYTDPYLRAYAHCWRLAWQEPRSGVRIWQRTAPYAVPNTVQHTPHASPPARRALH
ncbi:MAG: hypothetical protein RMJ43_03705 [Chloroherpetonaceae bacterium]|nr:hypothetical protein [Chthonomonadaceae bacterium]MDW8206917.1 hypothetical protein [Chloroherpetonaceae bacterium]